MRTMMLTGTMVLGMLAAAHLTAQEPPFKPGPEHAFLKQSEGTWDATIKSLGNESKGTITYKMDLNGLWLLEHFKADFGGMPFDGMGATGYDPAKKKYVSVWIDSMSPGLIVSEGTYDKATKTMTMFGNMPMPDGKTVKATITTVATDPNTKIFTIKAPGPDGKEAEMMHITYKRRVK
jgi:uncharacterized protein DUF1579